MNERAQVVALHTSSLEINELKALIEDKIQHTYLERYINKPIIDEDKLFILSVIFANTSMPTSKKKQYIITTMLAQIALDTHDLVPVTNDKMEGEENRAAKQLTVLAGDYYSGLYYLLLSEIEAFDMIHILASAIKEINEYKMKLYYQEIYSFQDLIHVLKKIESLLILRVAAYINEPILNPIIEDWLISGRLIQEKIKIHNKDHSQVVAYWLQFSKDNNNKLSLLTDLDNIIKQNTNRIEAFALQLPSHYEWMKNYIQNELQKLVSDNTSIAEEG